jgi:predicted nucleic acid-binding protein
MFVLDCFALAVLFERQPGWEIVRDHLEDAIANGYSHSMSAINFGEFYYTDAQKNGFEHAETSRELAKLLPIHIDVPTLEDIVDAAHIKGGGKASYADCFAADLAMKLNLPVLTGDREFEKLIPLGVKVEWLPPNR